MRKLVVQAAQYAGLRQAVVFLYKFAAAQMVFKAVAAVGFGKETARVVINGKRLDNFDCGQAGGGDVDGWLRLRVLTAGKACDSGCLPLFMANLL